MFHHDCSYNIRYILINTKPHIFRIPKNEVFKFQLLYQRSFQLKLLARGGKKELVNSFIVNSFQNL